MIRTNAATMFPYAKEKRIRIFGGLQGGITSLDDKSARDDPGRFIVADVNSTRFGICIETAGHLLFGVQDKTCLLSII